MGTETINNPLCYCLFVQLEVKLKNPLMGTETEGTVTDSNAIIGRRLN